MEAVYDSSHAERVNILTQAMEVVIKDEAFSFAVRCAAATLKEELEKDTWRSNERIVP